MLGDARDLHMAALQIPTAQYDADSKKLVLLKSVDVTLNFTGGPHTFSEQLGNPYEQAQRRLANGLLNSNVVVGVGPVLGITCGEELLVITNPSTLCAANTYATARSAAGLPDAGAPDRRGFRPDRDDRDADPDVHPQRSVNQPALHPPELRDDHRRRRARADVHRPGPAGSRRTTRTRPRTTPTSCPTSLSAGSSATPSRRSTRRSRRSSTTRRSPPTGPMLNKATIAAQFQDTDEAGEVNDGQEDRTFIQFAETVAQRSRRARCRRSTASTRTTRRRTRRSSTTARVCRPR